MYSRAINRRESSKNQERPSECSARLVLSSHQNSIMSACGKPKKSGRAVILPGRRQGTLAKTSSTPATRARSASCLWRGMWRDSPAAGNDRARGDRLLHATPRRASATGDRTFCKGWRGVYRANIVCSGTDNIGYEMLYTENCTLST